jgi:hypothetical protein
VAVLRGHRSGPRRARKRGAEGLSKRRKWSFGTTGEVAFLLRGFLLPGRVMLKLAVLEAEC